ncbi:MAG: hypothetical protein JW959_05185 [Pirellulales bacterium]|nr:hypothetical protein [Pirellulales bacterium]
MFPWRQARLVHQLGGEAARECREDLWRRIGLSCRNMDIPEIRGYVRAQAARPLASEVERTIERHRVAPGLKGRIIEAAIVQMVGMIVRDVLGDPYMAPSEKIAA